MKQPIAIIDLVIIILILVVVLLGGYGDKGLIMA